jgi:hypothetical protein
MKTAPKSRGRKSLIYIERATGLEPATYHSHVDEGKDVNAGLIGPIIITRRGMSRADGSPRDVDREFVTEFGLFDEPRSWYWSTNVVRMYGDSSKYDGADVSMHQWHHFYTINGFLQGNGPMLTMRDDPGIWLLHCHMPGHFRAGMYTRFTVSRAPDAAR